MPCTITNGDCVDFFYLDLTATTQHTPTPKTPDEDSPLKKRQTVAKGGCKFQVSDVYGWRSMLDTIYGGTLGSDCVKKLLDAIGRKFKKPWQSSKRNLDE